LHRQPKILPVSSNFGSANGLPNILYLLAGEMLAKWRKIRSRMREKVDGQKMLRKIQEAQSTGREIKKESESEWKER